MFNSGDVVKRNGNYFRVKHDNNGHYFVALLMADARITAWHRVSLKKLKTQYEKIDDYNDERKMEKWKL